MNGQLYNIYENDQLAIEQQQYNTLITENKCINKQNNNNNQNSDSEDQAFDYETYYVQQIKKLKNQINECENQLLIKKLLQNKKVCPVIQLSYNCLIQPETVYLLRTDIFVSHFMAGMAITEKTLNYLNQDLQTYSLNNKRIKVSAFNTYKDIEYAEHSLDQKQVSVYVKDKANINYIDQQYLIKKFKSQENQDYIELAHQMEFFDIKFQEKRRLQKKFNLCQQHKRSYLRNRETLNQIFEMHSKFYIFIMEFDTLHEERFLDLQGLHYNTNYLKTVGWEIDEFLMTTIQSNKIIETFFPNPQLKNIGKWFNGFRQQIIDHIDTEQIDENQKQQLTQQGNIILTKSNIGLKQQKQNHMKSVNWQDACLRHKSGDIINVKFHRQYYFDSNTMYIVLVCKDFE
ncbi:hypothetical protein PPERSA_03957 [Pseudocohnilembus persalinus]|uniref:Uncharacterized protein n=1 Tax=Pseudocohnilembus persalinus TaxID=266149 RepID=A0A0V0QAJ8_PSEPJ|nr:hypothetical protein PPERSA_03957 [Pseudocohnilembus persalinus]|eukprot:KRW99251.1 hypothetical protein PPERSA_03957 [Pseudocohnilembus persalinus]